ncbi:kinase [bacterium]|jgi:D-glycero-alpha-D-manno-heptose-7-phosphate kinase|nr:kinase [bacterium]
MKKKHVIVSSPYRISLGGGGTDLPFYASKKGGFLITAAIDEFITVSVAKRYIDKKIFLQYSSTEIANSLDEISHKLFKEVLKYFKIKESFQIATFSTLPSYTGLGASSTLIVGLVKAIYELNDKPIGPIKLAEEAFHIEREILGLAGGYQDQYIAALGGIQILNISKELKVNPEPLVIGDKELEKLQNSLFLIHTGIERNSEKIISDQQKELNIFKGYDQIKAIGKSSAEYIQRGEVHKLGISMDNHWKIKKRLTKMITNSSIDKMYLELKSFGSPGGKIIGAGGGGFFLMVVDKNQSEFIRKAKESNYKFINFVFETKGAHTLE